MPTTSLRNLQGLATQNGSGNTGHTIYGLKEPVTLAVGKETKRVIYKHNKHDDPNASKKEVAFGEVARCVMSPYLTPKTHLIAKDGCVTGVAVEFAQHNIAQYAPLNSHTFYHIESKENGHMVTQIKTHKTLDIPFEFLNQKTHGFFADLMTARKAGKVSVDMDSLVDVLGTSYLCEEDDLHKGNIGYFVTQGTNDAKPRVVFFKIDHDLMFMNSIMSYSGDIRFANLYYTSDSYQITTEDLENFPDINYSGHYWPTKSRYVVPQGEDKSKTYSDPQEISTFAKLKNDPEFIHAKWRKMLKHALTPISQVKHAVAKKFDLKDDDSKLIYDQTINAFASRRTQLRTMLLASNEFKSYL